MELSQKDIDRFWTKVAVASWNECWLWQGPVHRRGLAYGRLQTKKLREGIWRTVWYPAHRVSFYLTHGRIDPKLFVMHTCDVPACVNPAHLVQGSAKDNTRDMLQKRRANKAQGESHGQARLAAEDVREIRSLYAAGGITQQALADRFGVSFQHVSSILSRKTWTHI